MPTYFNDESDKKSGPRYFDDNGAGGGAAQAPVEPWNDPAMPVARDLKTIPRAMKHGLLQAGNLIGLVSDEEVKKHRESMNADPFHSKVGEAVGSGLLAAPVASLGVGAGLVNAGLVNAAAGGIFSDPGQRGINALISGGVGMGAEGLTSALPLASNWIGNKFLNNTAGRISPRNKLSQAATDAAYEAGAIRPLKTIKGAAATLEEASDAAGERIGDVLARAGDSGITGPNAERLAEALERIGKSVESSSLNPSDYALYSEVAKRLRARPTDAAGNLGIAQSEAMKTSLQKMAKAAYRAVPGSDVAAAPETARHVASLLRMANEHSMRKGATAASGSLRLLGDGSGTVKSAASPLYGEFMAAKEAYGPLRDAFRAAGEGAARAGNRSFLGVPEAMMLATEGIGPATTLKLARTFMPQTAGYAAWRGGQMMANPTANLLVRALASEAASREDE